jgi:hypothetical protein
MHLAYDYIHPYRAFRSSYSQCRIRIYVPDEKADAAVVVYLQLPTNPGTSTTNSVRIIAGEATNHRSLKCPRCGSNTIRLRLRSSKPKRSL